MKLIPDWHLKHLTCSLCGETQSVKYELELYDFESNIPRVVYVCNKCAFAHNKKETNQKQIEESCNWINKCHCHGERL